MVMIKLGNNNKVSNFVRLRRVDMRREESTFRFSADVARKFHVGRAKEVPEHLVDLYEQAKGNSRAQNVRKLHSF